MGGADGVEVAGEVQVNVFHGHDLGVAAAGRAAFYPETGTQGRFAQADNGLFTDAVHGVAQSHGGGGLAFAGRRRADGGGQDKLGVRAVFQAVDIFQGHLGLVVPIGLQVLVGDPVLLLGKFQDADFIGFLGNFDIGHIRSPWEGYFIIYFILQNVIVRLWGREKYYSLLECG